MKRVPDLDFDGLLAANRKQAMIPAGADVIDRLAPRRGGGAGAPTISSFPARRVSCRPCGPTQSRPRPSTAHRPRDGVRASDRPHVRARRIGLAGNPAGSRAAGRGFSALEITTCLRRGEIEMVTR